MKTVFLSNYFNHHQSALSRELSALCDGSFCFIKTTEIGAERVALGWKIDEPDYVIQYYDDEEKARRLIDEADVLIYGSAPEELLKNRLKENKLIFKYSERIYKNFKNKLTLPLRIFKYRMDYGKDKNVFLLCASAYAAADYSKTLAFRGKAYKWGYFPETKTYDARRLIKEKQPYSILWVGRFVGWKHPEAPILLAEKLKKVGFKFKLGMAGTGKDLEKIKKLVEKKKLGDNVTFLGAMPPEKVRENMEKSQIFVCTSDFNEGWGVVVGEAMNSGCAVVASHAIGSAPYLIENGKNGFLYKSGDIGDLTEKVANLLADTDKCEMMGKSAYDTILNEWNASVAARRLVALAGEIASGKTPDLYDRGPCSRAEILGNGFKYEK